MSIDAQVPAVIAHPMLSPAAIAELETVPVKRVPAAVTVTVPMVVGAAHVELVPHSYSVIVGFETHENVTAEPTILLTVDAFTKVL